jgi:hypothetical protein
VTLFATIETFNIFQMLTIVYSSTAVSSTSPASYAASIALTSTTAPAIGIVMISFTNFYFSIIGLGWNLSSHLCNDMLLLICLPLLAVNIQLIF